MRNIIVGLSTLVSTSVPLASAARTASSISTLRRDTDDLEIFADIHVEPIFVHGFLREFTGERQRAPVLRFKHGKGSQHDPLNLIERGLIPPMVELGRPLAVRLR